MHGFGDLYFVFLVPVIVLTWKLLLRCIQSHFFVYFGVLFALGLPRPEMNTQIFVTSCHDHGADLITALTYIIPSELR